VCRGASGPLLMGGSGSTTRGGRLYRDLDGFGWVLCEGRRRSCHVVRAAAVWQTVAWMTCLGRAPDRLGDPRLGPRRSRGGPTRLLLVGIASVTESHIRERHPQRVVLHLPHVAKLVADQVLVEYQRR
jgi:hypothetical protein